MWSDRLTVARAAFSIEEPWIAPAASEAVRLRLAMSGHPPRLSTSVSAWYDDDALTVLFCAADDHVTATHLEHDAPLWKEDAVEVFLAPERLTEYFEIEVNPLATTFDARIDSPDGVRQTMKTDLGWTCRDLMAALRRTNESQGRFTIDTVIRIPFASLGREAPVSGEEWRANFFRIDRHPRHGNEFSAWRPTMISPPDFHVAAAFGRLVFG